MKYLCLILLALFGSASATCYCPGNRNIVGCNDVELQGECKRGEWELENWIGAVMQYGDAIIHSMLHQDTPKDPNWVAVNRAALSDAVEHEKPIIDCNSGLFTETRNPNTYRFCYSPQLLEQCYKLLNSTANYQASVVDRLQVLDGVDPEFIRLMRIRTELTMTIDVSCQTSEKVQAELSSGDNIDPNFLAILIGLILNVLYNHT